VSGTPGPQSLFVAGVSYRAAPVEVRERLALDESRVTEMLGRLRADVPLGEVMVLSTCNRVEIYGVIDTPDAAGPDAFRTLCRHLAVDEASVLPLVYVRSGDDAIGHCFRVAASLDSMVVGEPQILGQIKTAFGLARDRGTVGTRLHRLMTQAFAVAKKVRSETELGRHAVSVSFAAVELARKIFGSLADRRALLIGAGEMGELAARHLVDQGVSALWVANRTWSRAVEVATSLGAEPIPLDRSRAMLATADIIITSTAAPEPIITTDDVRLAMARRARPLFLIDIAIPRNVEAGVNDLPNVFCYDVDDLRQVVDANAKERKREAEKAETIVLREVQKFVARLAALDAVPTIVSLRERIESIRQRELERTLARLTDASPETRAALDALSTAIVNKILHAPLAKLNESSRNGHGSQLAALVTQLFALEPPPASASEPATREAPGLGLRAWSDQPTS
jgi:glutamyl-tRNA reductase